MFDLQPSQRGAETRPYRSKDFVIDPAVPFDAPLPERQAWLTKTLRAVEQWHRMLESSESTWSWLRLLVFAAAFLPWWLLASQPWFAAACSAVLLVLFGLTVWRHARLRAARDLSEEHLRAMRESEQRLGGKVTLIRTGQRPANKVEVPAVAPIEPDGDTWTLTDQERDDLDLFASPVGIYGLLNRTSTLPGALRLRTYLDQPLLDAERIRRRQEAVRWLADHTVERTSVLGALGLLRREERRLGRLIGAIGTTRPVGSTGLQIGLRIWALVSIAFAGWALMAALGGNYAPSAFLGLLLAVNSVIYFSLAGRVAEALGPWSDTHSAVRGYATVAREAAEALPDDGLLGVLRSRFAAVAAPHVLPRLAGRLGWIEGGGFLGLLLNILAFVQFHAAARVSSVATPHQRELQDGLSALAELEALASLACFAWEQPTACLPEPTTGVTGAHLEIVGGLHPLVDPQRVRPNSVHLDPQQRVWVITGSNMAGKSTFLRMIGVCALLGQCGGAVPAERMRWTPLRLLSDLRARDNLAGEESYFLAEVRHLRRMVLPPTGDQPLLGLIDEPFRGTNSHDQTAASRAVLAHLIRSPHLFIVATHDRYLTELADEQRVRNFHFRENLSAAGMVFDYHLYDGPATTRNALRVLEREGYPESLLAEARAWHGDEPECAE